MTDRDYLWCALNFLLDDEERLNAFCPACRAEAEEKRCSACGAPVSEGAAGVNGGFDPARFEQLSREAAE
ncbi:MAG: molybdopterin oxidoreductase [Clostridia bacterium]|nr:molybdopterin oxidoreductase [Clostridia bacterium]